MTRARDISRLLGRTDNEVDSEGEIIASSGQIVDSAFVLSQTPAAAAFQFYTTLDSLPSSPDAGTLAFVEANTRMYLNDGNGWYSIAAVNLSPSLTLSPEGTITLDTDGSPATVTITATDADDPSAILSYTVESDGNMLATGTTVTQDSSVFTITPLTQAGGGVAGNFTLSFKVSDQIDEAVANKSFSLSFASVNSVTFSANDAYIVRLPSDTSTVTLNTTGYSNGATIPYTITGVTSSDITNSLTGNYTVGTPIVLTGAGINKTRADQTGTFTADGVSGDFYVITKKTGTSNGPFSSTPYIVVRNSWYNYNDGTNQTGIIIGPVTSSSFGGSIALRIRKFLAGEPGSTSTYQFYAGNPGLDAYKGSFRAIKVYGVLNGTPTHTHTFTWARTCGEMVANSWQSSHRGASLYSAASTPNYVTRTFTHSSYSNNFIDNICFIEYYSDAAATSLINTSFWDGTGGYLV
jgi:hypothetical protein